MKSYELAIQIINENYVDSLIVALVRQGYSVYLNEDSMHLCIEVPDSELTEINKKEFLG